MKLTDEQIAELAPEWATHYHVNGNNLCFLNQNNAVLVSKSGDYISCIYENELGIEAGDIPVSEVKPFDISEHKFSDKEITHCLISGGEIYLSDGAKGFTLYLSRDDATALAKHFKLTAEDLK